MNTKKFQSTKTYGNDRGFSCCFRQWKARSHCRLLHGYSLGFRFVFETYQLDENNWVYDFGSCDWIRKFLSEYFDHTLIVAKDDPLRSSLQLLADKDCCRMVTADSTGCEKFAEFIMQFISPKVAEETKQRVRVLSVEVFEHGANSAIVYN